MKWAAVVTPPNEPIGESWAVLLRERSIPAYVLRDTVPAYLGTAFTPVRLMVPEDKLDEAKVVLDSLVGPDEEPPSR